MIRLVQPEIGEEEIRAVGEVLRSGYLVQGSHVREFENQIAEYVGTEYAVAVSSGTAALHLAILAIGIGPGDEVIIPDFTFPATANVVKLAGGIPILVDIDLRTFNINTDLIQRAITKNTKAIMPVHLFGHPAEMATIYKIAQDNNLFVIEDAACALGSLYNGKKCGGIGDAGCLSFHPRKAITTGEGGMVLTNDQNIASTIRQLRNHGMEVKSGKNIFQMAGFNYRMTDFQAILGAIQMSKIENIIQQRQKLAGQYSNLLSGIENILTPSINGNVRHIWQSYVVLVKEGLDRDQIIVKLKNNGVETTIGTYSLHIQPAFSPQNYTFPISAMSYERSICLPLHTHMGKTDIEVVVDKLIDAIKDQL